MLLCLMVHLVPCLVCKYEKLSTVQTLLISFENLQTELKKACLSRNGQERNSVTPVLSEGVSKDPGKVLWEEAPSIWFTFKQLKKIIAVKY